MKQIGWTSRSDLKRTYLYLLTISFHLICQAQLLPASRLKVLLVGSETRQDALEAAQSLSLEQSHGTSQMGGNSSLSHQKESLASLTLHQRNVGKVDFNSTTKPQRSPDLIDDPWREMHLHRIRPSWLSVDNRYKITSSSIEEVELFVPVEYMLRSAFDSPILLKTKLGILEGVRSIKFNKHLYTFLSVPYAKAPVAELRFRAPQPVEEWNGILQATKWPPFCVQPSMTLASKSSPVHVLTQIMSEDCLYLNIWTPSLKFNKSNKRPVMVWLHGGAFQYGGISVDENDGSALALLGDVVVVTLNYRISAFGFLNANNPTQAPNNVGLLDQRLAMEWVQANIKQFGGDPQQVTLFGESAGGHSVGMHLISPGSQNLFRRAIFQSGVPTSLLRSYDVNADNKGPSVSAGIGGVMMARRLKCLEEPVVEIAEPVPANETSTSETLEEDTTETPDAPILSDSTLACMRDKSSLEILKAMGAPGNAGFFPTADDAKGVFSNGPIMDSFDPDNLKIGPQKDFLIGTNTDEGTFMLHFGIPQVFPAKEPPKVDSIDALKAVLTREIDLMRAANTTAELSSASGETHGGPQAHLYKPLLRTSSTILESFMAKSQVRVLDNGTVIGNTSVFNKQVEFGKNVGSLITDIIFLCPSRTLAQTLSEAGRNVNFYLYSHRSSKSQYHEWIGVTHHDEVEFVFGRPLRMADVYSGKDIEMSQRLIKTWAHFAHTGQMLDQLGVSWPKYGAEDGNYMLLAADKAQVGQRLHDKVCNIYDTVISVHLTDN